MADDLVRAWRVGDDVRDALTALLDAAVTHGAPCRHRTSRWFSTKPEDIEQAIAGCRACPIRQQCTEYADLAREAFGVWGAVDRSAKGPNRATP